VVARVGDGRVEQCAGDALAAGRPGDDEADDRPDRAIVDRCEHLRMLQPLVVVARTEADPADGLAVPVGDQARGATLGRGGHRGAFQDRTVAHCGGGPEVDAANPIERAPAPFRVAPLPEQTSQIRQALGGQGQDLQVGRGRIGHARILDR
jgi:hypothetical protein